MGMKTLLQVGHLYRYVAFLFKNATLSHLRNRTVWLYYVNFIMRHHQHNTPDLKDDFHKSFLMFRSQPCFMSYVWICHL